MPLYFAYGSNMDSAAMALRCPASRLVGLARLHRHRFIIMRGGLRLGGARPGADRAGVLWDLALADVPALDRYESVRAASTPRSPSPS